RFLTNLKRLGILAVDVMNKKGQFKIQQMAFMLIAVVVFFALVGLFVLAFGLASLKDTANLLEEQNAMLLVSKLAESPEFSCGNSYGGARVNCVDFDKVMALRQERTKYKDFWGVSNIEIRKVSSSDDEDVLCTGSNYPDCNIVKILESTSIGYDYGNFVSLCWKESDNEDVYDKCEIAKLTVRYKERL
ncbi:MAG: hypothetical protein WD876_01310, partial [Candidatus Pacearchaeota archaeon]